MKQHEGEGLIWAHDRKSKVAGGSLEGEIRLTSQKKEEAEKGDPRTQRDSFFPLLILSGTPNTAVYPDSSSCLERPSQTHPKLCIRSFLIISVQQSN